MSITIVQPKEKRGLPSDHEVMKVVEVFAATCGFDPEKDNLHIKEIGGERRNKFSDMGVKLLKAEQYHISICIGCPTQTVEAHFSVKGQGGRATPGSALWDTVHRAIGGRIFLVDKSDIRALRIGKHETLGNNGVTRFSPVASVHEEPEVELVSEQVPELVEKVVDVAEVIQPAPAIAEAEYSFYYENPRHLHTVVLALSLHVEEDVNKAFSFHEFEKVLEDAGVQEELAGRAFSQLRIFQSRGYMVRINPDRKPAQFSITELAIEFARGPVPSAPVPRLNMLPKKSIARKEPKSETAPSAPETHSFAPRVAFLKKKAEQYAQVENDMRAAEASLLKLDKDGIDSAETDIKGQIANLENRIEVLKDALKDLGARRTNIATLEKRIAHLAIELSNPELTKAIAELVELKKLLQ